MDVEPFGIALAFDPVDDVRRAQQGLIGDAGQRAAALPVNHQAGTKNVLADPLHHQPLGLGYLGQSCDANLEFPQRRVEQAYTQRINAIQCRIESAERIEGIAGFVRTGQEGGG